MKININPLLLNLSLPLTTQIISQAMLRLHADAIDEFEADTTVHGRVELIKLDLGSLQSVMNFVEEFKGKGYPLHLLICNAGCITAKKGKYNTGGISRFLELLIYGKGQTQII